MPFEFEVYCAICGVTLATVNCIIAEHASRRYRRIRRRVLEKRTGAPQHEDDSDLDDEEITDSDEESDLDEWDDERNALEHSYDPRILHMEQLGWLEALCTLGGRLEDDGHVKPVLIRPVFEQDDGAMEVHDDAEPAEFRGMVLSCYDSIGEREPHTYPMHQACYDMFRNMLADDRGVKKFDESKLYVAMVTITEKHDGVLKLDYGDVTGRDQEWMSIPGEEYTVTCPIGTPDGLLSEIETFAPRLSPTSAPARPSRQSMGKDVFSKLPHELITHVLGHLSPESLKSLLIASWPAYTAAQGKGFWQGYVQRSMPWFFELKAVTTQTWAADIDFKEFCFWLEYKTRVRFNREGPFLQLTNRRRIWGVCEQLARVYENTNMDLEAAVQYYKSTLS